VGHRRLASKNQLDALTDPKRGRDGLFPELALFDCHSCHHPMSDKKWTPRLGVGPGRMRLNDSNLLMLRAIVRATDPANANAFSASRATAPSRGGQQRQRRGRPQRRSVGAGFGLVGHDPAHHRQAGTAALRAVQRAVLAGLIDEAKRQQYSDYAGAEQAYMAISSLSSSLAKQGALTNVAEMNRKLATLRVSLANEDAFKPDVFANGLQGLSRTISPQAN
jgi:hypothetical protein